MGGAGAAPGIEASPGLNGTYSQAGGDYFYGGGGGGGLGRIRYNTETGTYVKSSAALEAGAVTVGTVGSR